MVEGPLRDGWEAWIGDAGGLGLLLSLALVGLDEK